MIHLSPYRRAPLIRDALVMKIQSNRRLLHLVAVGFCGLGFLGSAFASPPLSLDTPSLAPITPARSGPVARRLFAHQEHISATLLNLRWRDDSSPAINRGRAGTPASALFPSAIHHLEVDKPNLRNEDRIWLRALVTGESNFQMMSPAQTLVRRVHREGLPLARLWESKSALVSIGLNQKGKPGLWLIQKTH